MIRDGGGVAVGSGGGGVWGGWVLDPGMVELRGAGGLGVVGSRGNGIKGVVRSRSNIAQGVVGLRVVRVWGGRGSRRW